VQETRKPPKQGFPKSTEQNQPTGAPSYVVTQQTSEAQKTISTPKKKKNKKKLFRARSKAQNTARTNGVAAPPSPNDYVSYGITAHDAEKNAKEITKQKSVNQQQISGDATLANSNKIKGPRKEATKGGNLKGGLPAGQRSAKSAEQNQPTGAPDYIVTEQTNEAQKIISTPYKKVNKKELLAGKSKEQNVANQNGNPYPPSPNDYISYGITAHEPERNTKELLKQKSDNNQLILGNDLLEKQYNIKPPRKETKRGGVVVSGVPVSQRADKSAAETGFQGDREPRSQGIPNNSSTSLIIPLLAKSKNDVTHMTTHEGTLDSKSEGIINNSSTSMVIPLLAKSKNDVTHMTTHEGNIEGSALEGLKGRRKSLNLEIGSNVGDLQGLYQQTRETEKKNAGIVRDYKGNSDYGILANQLAHKKEVNREMGSNQGDIAGGYEQMREKEKVGAIKVRDYKGSISYGILAKQVAHEKDLDREMGSNQGDIAGGYEQMRDKEKVGAIKVRDFKGTYDYDVLGDREAMRKEKETEIAKNTGDIIGSYMDMRKRWKEKSEKIKDYRGEVDYSVLKKNKDKMLALGKEMYSNTGDVLTVSLEKKKATMREKSRKATGYEGDMVVTKRTRSNHPSAVYIEAKDSKSMEAKERLRKQFLKKARYHREKEDPKYMQNEFPRPRYDEREYQIWESKTRETDTALPYHAIEEKKK